MLRVVVRLPGKLPPTGDLPLDVGASTTVGELKAIVAERHPDAVPAGEQRLIVGARTLDDDSTASVVDALRRVRRDVATPPRPFALASQTS